MNPSKDISVVMPVFNGEAFIEQSLISVLRQTILPLELIVINDGSTDNTGDKVNRFISTYPELKVILINSENRGPGNARNIGIGAAKGRWIAFLDSDDLWLPKKLEVTANHHKDNVETNFICHNEIHRRGDDDKQVDYFHKFDQSKSIASQLFQKNFFSTSAVACQRNLLIEYDGFDISLPNAQDFDFWLRMSPKIRLLPISDLLGIYVEREDNITSRPVMERGKNLYRVYKKNKNLVSNLVYFKTLTKFLASIMLELIRSLKKSEILFNRK